MKHNIDVSIYFVFFLFLFLTPKQPKTTAVDWNCFLFFTLKLKNNKTGNDKNNKITSKQAIISNGKNIKQNLLGQINIM